MEEIKIIEVNGGRDLKRFMQVPHDIYRNDPKWVPPLEMDLKKTLARSYPFFEHGDGQLFLAMRGGRPVGRISAQVNDAHLSKYNDGVGFFGWFECIDDQQVCDALVSRAKEWLRACGRPLTHIRGPLNWDINGENPGVLVEDHRPGPPAILMAHSAPWYDRLLTNAGFAKEKDLFAWWVVEREGLGDDMMRVAKMAEKRLPPFTTRPIDFKKGFKADMQIVRELFNSAWSENWGSVDLTQAEIDVIAKGLKPIAAPEVTRV
ncbi:MAG: N-acetyltransferase, partial [Planctomycetes bacterium]|nr:N-acetyltransferase [Planctomycetota bacterium]